MQNGFVTISDAETEVGGSTKNCFICRNLMQYFPLISNFQVAMYVIQFLLDVEAYVSDFKKLLSFLQITKKHYEF